MLSAVSLELHRGQLCALLGANGAGKSTLIGILSTLVRPTAGEVVYRARGQPLTGLRLRREIGFLAHDSFIYGQLSARENLEFYGRLYQMANAKERSENLLDRVGLDKKARSRPAATFSRGMLQRLALARALLHNPSLLFLDEPFTGLDRVGAKALVNNISTAKERGGLTLVASHNLEAIAEVADHVLILRQGTVAHEESRQQKAPGFSPSQLEELYHQHGE